MKYILAIITLLVCVNCQAQQKEIDSLEKLLETAKLADTVKIGIFNNLAFAYAATDPAKGLIYADLGIALASKTRVPLKLGAAYNCKALNYTYLGQDSLAFKNYSLALKTAQDNMNKNGEAIALNNLAILYTNRSEYQKALDSRLKALAIFKDLKSKRGINVLTTNIAVNYMYLADYPRSIAIVTVLLISRFKRSLSFSRSFLNFVNELESITPSSDDISRKYLKDISYCERSTTSTSETV